MQKTNAVRLILVVFIGAFIVSALNAHAARGGQKPGEGVWRNYDFTPGKTVWVVTDFSNEQVGRFPTGQLEFVKGNMQIVELNGERVLEVSANSVFRVNLPEELPADFTLELSVQSGAPNMATRIFFSPPETPLRQYASQYLVLNRQPGVYYQGQAVSTIDTTRGVADEWTGVRFQSDGEAAIMYVNTERAADVPKAELLGSNTIEFHVGGNKRRRSYVKDIVVAVGLDNLYEALTEAGEFTTRGIYFDVGSDVLRPESTPVLEEIRETLEGHTDLRILIEGHTDSSGEDEYNQSLSERRARAVVEYLIQQGIDEIRLSSTGKGETEPVADNESAKGRAQNRRVVIKRAEG